MKLILKRKYFSFKTKAAKEEILDYVEGKKLVDFSKISEEDAKKLKKMLSSLNHGKNDFMWERNKPYVPKNVEEIFDKLGMEKTKDGIREMIHKSTDPDILRKKYVMNYGNFKQIDPTYKNKISRDFNNSASENLLTFADHNTPHKRDNGDEISWYNKNVAKKDKNGKIRKIRVVDDEIVKKLGGGGLFYSDIDSGQTKGIILGKSSKNRPGLIEHESGHEQGCDSKGRILDASENNIMLGGNIGGGIGEELVASTRANKNMKEIGKSKEEIRQGNKMNGLALRTYLPYLTCSNSPMSDYLIDKTHLAKKDNKIKELLTKFKRIL